MGFLQQSPIMKHINVLVKYSDDTDFTEAQEEIEEALESIDGELIYVGP